MEIAKKDDMDKNSSKIKVALPRMASSQGPTLGMIKEVELPKIIQNIEKSWTTIAWKGLNKAGVVQGNNI